MVQFNLLTTTLLAAASLSALVSADDVLTSSGFTNCIGDASIKVNHASIKFSKSTGNVTFDASGTSTKSQKVKANLLVTAYGVQVFQKDFDPCDSSTYVQQLCPVPEGNFSASGTQVIPADYLAKIPAIAFSVPDIDADAELHLTNIDTNQEVACVKSGVTNGQSLNSPALQGVGAGILAGALVLAGIGAAANAGAAGSTTMSPSFGTMLGWFQGMAMNGMLSVNYPSSYRNFAGTFGFSTGVIPWNSLQLTIDDFRNKTGGNLTDDNVKYLQNATLIYNDGEHNTTNFKRSLVHIGELIARDITTSINGSSADNDQSGVQKTVHGLEAYVEMLSVPQANTFMNVLLVFAIIVGAIIVGILGFKLILEMWSLWGKFPQKLTGFRKRYWRVLANTITNLILLLYGIWTIWCIFQFTNGDSWAAKTLAGVTWGIFTATLIFYTIMVFTVVRKHKQVDGTTDALYEDKDTWHKYSFLYDSYKRGYWWLFVPMIIYMFAKGVVIAAGNGHGLGQTVAQLIIESIMFIVLLWSRPFATKGSNWINIAVQVVRVLSVICILVFVEELGIAQTTQTITGVVLIAVQCTLTGILGILLIVNAIRLMFRENIHKKQRKEALKNKQLEAGGAYADEDPADIPMVAHRRTAYGVPEPKTPLMRDSSPVDGGRLSRPVYGREDSGAPLVSDAASLGRVSSHERSVSRGRSVMGGADDGMGGWPLNRPMSRQPMLPALEPGVATVGNGRPAFRPVRQPILPRLD